MSEFPPDSPSPLFCDVSLPVPLDRPFTYSLPEAWRHRASVGARVLVPFGPRKMTGMIVRLHDAAPAVVAKPAERLLDEEPLLDSSLLSLARWIAAYYCTPLGEVLRTMTPLSGSAGWLGHQRQGFHQRGPGSRPGLVPAEPGAG